MIGYHYTSFENWTKIKVEGLKPVSRTRKQPDIIKYFGDVPCVWIYTRKAKGVGHFGNFIWHLADKNTTKVVMLEVTYDKEDELQPLPKYFMNSMILTHSGKVGQFKYHVEPFMLLGNMIPPERLRLCEMIDFNTINEVLYADMEVTPIEDFYNPLVMNAY